MTLKALGSLWRGSNMRKVPVYVNGNRANTLRVLDDQQVFTQINRMIHKCCKNGVGRLKEIRKDPDQGVTAVYLENVRGKSRSRRRRAGFVVATITCPVARDGPDYSL